jgi:S1-C subfamily serine protease
VEPAEFLRDGRIRPGHVITEIEGQPVETLDDLLAVIDTHQAGEEVTVTFESTGGTVDVEMPLLPGA